MNLRRLMVKPIPQWVILWATDLRCRLRCWLVCSPIPYQPASPQPALIVAPHPDDETFGCGGLVSLKRAAGIPVRVVFFTDGEAVASGLGESVAAVVAARRREALNACQRIGVEAENVRWLHLPDGKLPHPGQSSFEEASRTLLAEIEAFVPGEIYCPHLLDVHRDHIAATRITHQAVRLWGQPCAVFYYPVWMWYHASSGLRKKLDVTGAWRVDISTVLTDKEHAMAAYLEAPKTSQGNPYCGRLPRSFLRNFRRNYEVIFSSKANADEILARPVK